MRIKSEKDRGEKKEGEGCKGRWKREGGRYRQRERKVEKNRYERSDWRREAVRE